jgi:dTDP-4-dehydrorhamnose reductase
MAKNLYEAITSLNASIAIIRLTKVIDPTFSLFKNWYHSFQQNEKINVFSDWKFSPIDLKEVIKFTLKITNNRDKGIYNLSALNDISYAGAAKILSSVTNCNKNLINEITVSESQFTPKWNPKNTTMQSSIELPSAEDCLVQNFQSILKDICI